VTPTAGVTEGTERDVDEPRSDRNQLLWRPAALAKCPDDILARRHLPCAPARAGYRHCPKRAGRVRPTACRAGIQFLVPRLGRCAPVILKTSAPCSASVRAQVGPARRESGRGRGCRERPIAGWKWYGSAVADAHDLHERQRRDRSALWMSRPFFLRSRHAAGALRSNDRLLKIGGVPSGTARAMASRSSATPSTLSAARDDWENCSGDRPAPSRVG